MVWKQYWFRMGVL